MTFRFIMTKPSLLSSILLLGVTTTTTTVAGQHQPRQVRFGRSMRKRSSTASSSSSPPSQRIREFNVMSPKVPLRVDDWSYPSALRQRRKLTSKPPMFSEVLDVELEEMSMSVSISLPSSFEYDFGMPTTSTTMPTATDPTATPGTSTIPTMPPTSVDHSEESHYVKIMVSSVSRQCFIVSTSP